MFWFNPLTKESFLVYIDNAPANSGVGISTSRW